MRVLGYINNFYGYGLKTASLVGKKYGFKEDFKLNKEMLKRFIIEDKESSIRFSKKKNIDLMQKLNTVKGQKHLRSLPVNGQRTKTNAKTRKKFKII